MAVHYLHYTISFYTINKRKIDSINATANRFTRSALRDSLSPIDNDSVKYNLDRLLGFVYGDSAKNPNRAVSRMLWDRLIYHLGNDSTFFWIHYANKDSLQVVLKNNQEVSAAIFLTNQQADSAKVHLRSNGKHDLHMFIDDGAFVNHVLKRGVVPVKLATVEKNVGMLKIPMAKAPPGLPQYWVVDGWVRVTLDKPVDNRLSFGFEGKGSANFNKGKMRWNSDYWYRYGTVKSEGQELFKNLDLMKANSNYLHTAFKDFSYSAKVSFDGQMFRGYKSPADSVPISKFMSPAKVLLGVGMEYKARKDLTINFQPVSGQFTFILDTITVDQTKFGLKEGQRVKGEPGATLTIGYNQLLWKNIKFGSTLRLFSNYLNNPEKVDVDWTTNLSMVVNKYVTTSLLFHVMYDDDIIIPFYEWIDGVKTKVGEGKKVQFMEQFGITFTYHIL